MGHLILVGRAGVPQQRSGAGFMGALFAALLGGCSYQSSEQQRYAAAACAVSPPFEPSFDPVLQWAWTGSSILPTHDQVMMTPVVIDLDQDGVPDVIFSTFAGANTLANGVVRAISGDDGHELWTVTDATQRVRPTASLAAGDLDGDGRAEICAIAEAGTGVLCFAHTGQLKVRTTASTNNWGGPALADLDGDGRVEILQGNHVFNDDGTVRWVGAFPANGPQGSLAFAADLDQDGHQEVVDGQVVYRSDGSLKCRNAAIGRGLSAVANFDADPFAELVVVGIGRIYLLDDDCTLRWSRTLVGGGNGGPPLIADLDGDGSPEIGVAGASRYVVLDASGTQLWSSAIADGSGSAAASAFDLEGDGVREILYADEATLRIFDGATGAVRFSVARSSGTTYDMPIVVDVDGDHHAEIVVAAANYLRGGATGVRVYRDRRDGWVDTRPVWNQHAYAMSNIDEDGSIPRTPVAGWLAPDTNAFRGNAQRPGYTRPVPAADLVVQGLEGRCVPGTTTLELAAQVANLGDAEVPAGLSVAFYRGEPGAGGSSLGVVALAAPLAPGAQTSLRLTRGSPDAGLSQLWAVVDDDGQGQGREVECDEDNNRASTAAELTCRVNQPPVAVCRDVTVSADATCRATASIDQGSYDPDSRPGPLTFAQTPPGPLGRGAHLVALTVSDGDSSASCTGTVTVVDVTPPAPGPSRDLALWPPNHALLELSLSDCAQDAVDACGGVLPVDGHGHIVRITSDEPDDAPGGGDGQTRDDIAIKSETTFDVRRERAGTGDGRVYTVHYTLADAAGNVVAATCQVVVPHAQNGRPAVDSGPASCVGVGCP